MIRMILDQDPDSDFPKETHRQLRPTRDGGRKEYRGQKARSSLEYLIAGDGCLSLFQDPGLDSRGGERLKLRK